MLPSAYGWYGFQIGYHIDPIGFDCIWHAKVLDCVLGSAIRTRGVSLIVILIVHSVGFFSLGYCLPFLISDSCLPWSDLIIWMTESGMLDIY